MTTTTVGNTNSNLHSAKRGKNDEFYTRMEDIEKELYHYHGHFRDKVVLLNCDDPDSSHFWTYFKLCFDFLGLKKLIATHYSADESTYKLELVRGTDLNGDGKIDGLDVVRTPLKGNGDFRSPECVELLKEADIVVTNPPFSLFRDYIAQLVEYDKKFLIIGNMNAITYNDVWPLIQAGKLWQGINQGNMEFRVPADSEPRATRYWEDDGGQKWRSLGNSCWFTNLDHKRRHEELPLFRKYDPEMHPTYDNYDAINVDKVRDIPCDFDGIMGVPITFLDKFNPDQFEVVRFGYGANGKYLTINGKTPYFRILIRRIK